MRKQFRLLQVLAQKYDLSMFYNISFGVHDITFQGKWSKKNAAIIEAATGKKFIREEYSFRRIVTGRIRIVLG